VRYEERPSIVEKPSLTYCDIGNYRTVSLPFEVVV
jgi:hypothetical protein